MCPHRWAPPRRRSPLHLSRCSSCHAQSPGPARHLYICHADGLVMRNPRVRRVNCRWSGAIDRSHSNCEAVFRPQTLRCEEAPVRAQSKRSPLIQTAKLGRKGGRALRQARGIRRPTVMPHPQARGRVKATKGYSNTVAHGVHTACKPPHGTRTVARGVLGTAVAKESHRGTFEQTRLGARAFCGGAVPRAVRCGEVVASAHGKCRARFRGACSLARGARPLHASAPPLHSRALHPLPPGGGAGFGRSGATQVKRD
jgi:hypothetical protein